MTPAETIAVLQADRDQLRTQLSQALHLRDDALGRASLADRRTVQALGEVSRLLRHRLQLARHLHDLLRFERQWDSDFHHLYRALSLPPILWPFIGAGLSIRRTWRRVLRSLRSLRRKVSP